MGASGPSRDLRVTQVLAAYFKDGPLESRDPGGGVRSKLVQNGVGDPVEVSDREEASKLGLEVVQGYLWATDDPYDGRCLEDESVLDCCTLLRLEGAYARRAGVRYETRYIDRTVDERF